MLHKRGGPIWNWFVCSNSRRWFLLICCCRSLFLC